MTPAQNTTSVNDTNKTTPPVFVSPGVSPGVSKEHEVSRAVAPETVSEITQEVELPIEVEKAGVEIIKDTIELPPDVKKLGVTTSGSSVQVASTPILPQIVLPISDQTVITGLHAQILSSLRWLAVWCVRRLKRAHIALKQIHGKIIRVKS